MRPYTVLLFNRKDLNKWWTWNGQKYADFVRDQFPQLFQRSANPRGCLLWQDGDPLTHICTPRIEIISGHIYEGGWYVNKLASDWFHLEEETNQLQDRWLRALPCRYYLHIFRPWYTDCFGLFTVHSLYFICLYILRRFLDNFYNVSLIGGRALFLF